MYSLCRHCNSRFSNQFKEGDCFLCDNKLEEFIDWLESEFPRIKEKVASIENAKYFSLSTVIPVSLLSKEEHLFDFFIGESLKNYLNSYLRKFFEEKLGLGYSVDNADLRITITFPQFSYSIKAEEFFIYGAYKKIKPGISQKRWKKYDLSVEKLIGERLSKYSFSSSYIMHASGREDVDAINLGFRPFVFELKNTKKRISCKELKKLEEKINSDNKEVLEVLFYGRAPRSFVTLVSDSHFDKSYRAYVSSKDSINDKKLLSILRERVSVKDNMLIYQKTPTRVLNRRSDLLRKRRIYSLNIGMDEKGVFVDIDCEAGLYIKEFISGDFGRTKPNLSMLTGKDLFCSFLIVKNINYSFLNEVFKNVGVKC